MEVKPAAPEARVRPDLALAGADGASAPMLLPRLGADLAPSRKQPEPGRRQPFGAADLGRRRVRGRVALERDRLDAVIAERFGAPRAGGPDR